ncbi:hypothetical protein OIE68_02920 [Nocardia vinacea]|uniref:hypothetical protein n=1 Tax=Nocardia vinacea TaxID=96468 RepID=UPI002E10E1BC|nr:hypothetical protein OIE68_02920 [Nocardia vinacea]
MIDMVEQARAAVARLQVVAAESDGRVRLGPGIADKVMDSWQVPVPPDVRLIAGEVGAIWFDEYDAIEFDHPRNDDPEPRPAQAPQRYRILHTNSAAETYCAEVDPETGAWGRIFYYWEDHSITWVAENLAAWLLFVAHGLDLALRIDSGEMVPELASAGHVDEAELPQLTFENVFRDWFGSYGEFFAQRNDPRATTPYVLD